MSDRAEKGCVGVIGAGAWGTALAQVAAANGHHVRLWARDPALVAAINERNENAAYLPGIALSPLIRATGDLTHVATAEANLIVTPAQAMRSVLADLPQHGQPLILCCKGIEAGSHLLMSEVAQAVHPTSPVMVLSGPTFAAEVARARSPRPRRPASPRWEGRAPPPRRRSARTGP